MQFQPTEIVNQIRQNLHDRYKKGFPVIKELVQNADDAGATCLHIGWTIGLSQTKHPLLQGPALFAANNGAFTEVNAVAINSIGLSRKEGESSIGKFGLGLKSVFHLCEAFFFLAFDHQTERRWSDIVNPWADGNNKDRFHQGWDTFDQEDKQILEDYLRRILGTGRYFCMWIPLRQKGCSSVAPITSDYPGARDTPPEFFSNHLAHHLAHLLPLLRNIQAVKGWTSNSHNAQPERIFQIALVGRQLRCPPDETEGGRRLDLRGKVEITFDPGNVSTIYPFRGFEVHLKDPAFEELQRSEKWPTYHDTDEKTGEYKSIRDRAEPHCAVCFMKRCATNRQGKLTISQAVFLPVDEPEESYKSIPCPGDADFSLTLHGFFFIDPGRSHIEGWETDTFSGQPQDEPSLRREWNGRLAQQGTLPLVLPALDRFVEEANLSEPEKRSLAEALDKSKLFAQYRQHICREHQWVYCLTAEGGKWQLLSAEDPVLEIPAPPVSAPERPRQVLPEIAGIQHITYRDTSRLSGSSQPSSWSEQQLLVILNCDARSTFGSQGNLEYLVTFLERDAGEAVYSPRVSDQLCKLARTAFQSVDLTELRRYKGLVQRFLNFVAPEKRFATRYDEKYKSSVIAYLVGLELDVLVVPGGFDNQDSPGTAQLTVKDAESILKCLAYPQPAWDQNDDFQDFRVEVALQIVEATSEQDELLWRCRDFELFQGRDLQANRELALSLSELEQLLARKMLFKYAPPPEAHGLANQLQRALQDARVVLVKGDRIVKRLSEQITPCNPNACVQTLLTQSVLAGATERIELLSDLLDKIDLGSQDNRQCMRYLLHGQRQDFDSNAPLLAEGTADDQGIWAKIVKQALGLSKSAWRIVPGELAERLAPRHRDLLGVEVINRQSTENLLCQIGPERIGITFGCDERDLLLREIQSDDVLKRLPIHEDVDGNLVSIGEHTYLGSDFDIGPVLRAKIVLVRRNPDRTLAFRQEQFIPKLTPEAAIGIALGQGQPHEHWRVIMDALNRLKSVGKLEPERLQALRETGWLPTRDGTSVPPQDVIHIRGAEDEIDRLVSTLGGIFVSKSALAEDVQQHSAFSTLAKTFPPLKDAAAMLGEIMARDDQYRIGPIDISDLDPKLFLRVFRQAPQVMPACPVLDAVFKAFANACREILLPQLVGEAPSGRMVAILNLLSEQLEAASGRQRKETQQVHNRYLTAAVKNKPAFFAAILPHIRLQNRLGQWTSPASLCFKADGISDEYLLADEQKKIVPPPEPSSQEQDQEALDGLIDEPEKDLEQQFKAGVKKLEEYFRDWKGLVNDEVIGGFLCLLGDHRDMRKLAQDYLRQRDIENTRKLLGWKRTLDEPSHRTGEFVEIIPSPDESEDGSWGDDKWGRPIFTFQRFLIEIQDEADTLQVYSLLGEPLLARRKPIRDLFHLFIGSRPIMIFDRIYCGYQINRLRLVRIHPRKANFTPQQLSCLLCESVNLILQGVYRVSVSDLDNAWAELDKSEQLDILIAQKYLLKSAFLYLKQLGVSTQEPIGQILNKWQEARRLEVEEEEMQKLAGRHFRPAAKEEMQKAQDKLRVFLEEEEYQDAKLVILEAFRRKIEQHQYKPTSIPFELFQNADDAIVELDGMMGGEPLGSETARFIVSWDSQRVSFIHWGRPINQFRLGSFERGRERGYDRDLEKMLVFSDSDKWMGAEIEPVTGKFGLGFKSVFLVTNSPLIVSGRLGFKIVGGLYPQCLSPQEFEDLNRQIGQFSSREPWGTRGTIIELPFKTRIDPKQDVLNDFLELIHVLLVFARRIKHCKIGGDGATSWEERSVLDAKGVYVGTLQPVTGSKETRALIVRSEEGALLLQLDSRGFSRLAGHIPTIWVTAPTQQKLDLGFALNGPFDLDVGRAQLAATSEQNAGLARFIGTGIGESLCQLFQAAQSDWGAFCQALDLAADVKPYEFWDSLWKLLAERFSQAASNDTVKLLCEILWGDSRARRGLAKLITEHPALPTRLWSEHQMLTRLGEVRYIVQGVLGDESVFNAVSKWPFFTEKVHPGTVVSSSVKQAIEKLLPNALKCKDLSLRDIVGWEIGSSDNADPKTAQRLGALITPQWISRLDPSEREELGERLKTVRFCGCDGKYHPARELLIAQDDAVEDDERDEYERQDEQKRARFAPSNRILGDDYRGPGLLFFKACRQRMEATVDTMVEWALSVGDHLEKERGVIQYLIEGQLSRALAEKLKSSPRMPSSWLSDIDHDLLEQKFRVYDVNQRNVILGLLGLCAPPPFLSLPPVDPKKVLPEIWEWWYVERESHISKYERQTYPDGIPRISTPQFDPKLQQDRERWLALFLLGSFYTMGRTIPGQHRNFLQLCSDRGWFPVFSAPDRRPNQWIDVLDEYLGEQVDKSEYYQWVKQYVSIYQLARWLREYVESFLAVDRYQKQFALDQILNLRISESQQFGGSNAPPIARTLGIGACFVMRELVRQRVLESPFAFEHCYVPSGRIRELFISLGCNTVGYEQGSVQDSITIHRFLVEHLGEKKATFDLSFDLPFLTICDGWGSIRDFMHGRDKG